MRRTLSTGLVLYAAVAALVIAAMLTVVIPFLSSLGDALQAGLARI